MAAPTVWILDWIYDTAPLSKVSNLQQRPRWLHHAPPRHSQPALYSASDLTRSYSHQFYPLSNNNHYCPAYNLQQENVQQSVACKHRSLSSQGRILDVYQVKGLMYMYGIFITLQNRSHCMVIKIKQNAISCGHFFILCVFGSFGRFKAHTWMPLFSLNIIIMIKVLL